MQKKLLAAAVSGALGAMFVPTVAQAQNATVSVFGTVYAEYASIGGDRRRTNGDSLERVDQWQNPGSEIGFRGEEKLGGGLSAWFQCTSTMDYRGTGNGALSNAQGQGFCDRNSALGMKGGFGNIFMGNWKTPFERTTAEMVGANQTGVYGTSRILYGQSSTFGISPPAGNINNATINASTGVLNNAATQTTLTPGAYHRRQNNLLTYETPNISGFSAMGAVTVGNNATGATSAQLKTRLWSFGVGYNNGPLRVGLAYEKHNDFYAATAAGCPTGNLSFAAQVPSTASTTNCLGFDEHAWALDAAYTFSNNLKVGAQYSQQKADVGIGQNAKVNTYMIGIDWMISGPHGLRANWAHAGDTKGTIGAAMGQRPTVNAAGDTSANMWQIRYVYQMSKRTEMTLGYSRINNGANANYEMGGTTTAILPGSDSNAIAIAMQHKF